MRQRGRKSNAEIETRVIDGGFGTRPKAPDDLSDDQASIWNEVVSSEDPNVFASAATRGMLKNYCRHQAASDQITRVINLFQDEWLRNSEGAKRYRELLRAREGETRAAASVATKLRLTNQARYTATAAGTANRNAAKGFKPWES